MGHRSVFAIAAFALAMALFFAASAFSLPPGNAAVPASLSFTAISMLGGAVGSTLMRQEGRIAFLERQLMSARGGA